MKKRKLYNIAFMGDKDHGCDIISTLESWGGSNYFSRIGNDPEYAYFINDLGTIDLIHNSAFLSEEMKNFYFMFWHDYSIECHLKVGETINYGGQDYEVDSIFFDANNRCIVYKLKSFGIGVEYITNNELIPTEKYQTEEENNEYLFKNNMETKLAIKGHATRGKEVIKLLEMMGGKNKYYYKCNEIRVGFTIGSDGSICRVTCNLYDEFRVFTLEEFLEKYPFKVGDKAVYEDDNDIVVISEIKWDDTVGDIFYNVKRIDEDDCFLCPPELLKPYKETNMNKKLAIRGHSTRGKEVIEILEMMGGKNNCDSPADNLGLCYLIDDEFNICAHYFGYDDYEDGELNIFTLEEFLKKYPFKVGDKVYTKSNAEGTIIDMFWDGFKVLYQLSSANVNALGYFHTNELKSYKETNMDENKFGTAKEPLKTKSNAVKLVDGKVVDDLEKMSVKNHKMGPKSKLPSKYYEEIQTKRDMDETMFMLGHTLVPNKMDDKLEYNIIDGYEFDRVENGKIILKPIKSKYPTNYQECCDVLGLPMQNTLEYINKDCNKHDYYNDLQSTLNSFVSLKICRDAYWKIAGEEMGLDKLWEPNWTTFEGMPAIFRFRYNIVCDSIKNQHCLLVFPTEEMRDAFYENFKNLIEQCKKLL